jgi:hypothetical protein
MSFLKLIFCLHIKNTFWANKRCNELYKLTSNLNPNSHKPEPVVALTVTCCTSVLVVHADTCPVQVLVYQNPISTKFIQFAYISGVPFVREYKRQTHIRTRERERERDREGRKETWKEPLHVIPVHSPLRMHMDFRVYNHRSMCQRFVLRPLIRVHPLNCVT